jgi:hypothetical protein
MSEGSGVHRFVALDTDGSLSFACFWCSISLGELDGSLCERRLEAAYYEEQPF